MNDQRRLLLVVCLPFMISVHPEVSVIGSSDINATEGEELAFTCRVTSIPQPVFTWLFNGTNISTTRSNFRMTQSINGDYSLIIKSAARNNTGIYTCQVNNTAIPEVVTRNFTVFVSCEWCYTITQICSVHSILVLI